METNRRQPSSRSERQLAQLVEAHTQPRRPTFPLDVVFNADVEFVPARE